MGESIHQLNFMKHILPVRSQQIHLEDHYFVRGPVSHLLAQKKKRKTKIKTSVMNIV